MAAELDCELCSAHVGLFDSSNLPHFTFLYHQLSLRRRQSESALHSSEHTCVSSLTTCLFWGPIFPQPRLTICFLSLFGLRPRLSSHFTSTSFQLMPTSAFHVSNVLIEPVCRLISTTLHCVPLGGHPLHWVYLKLVLNWCAVRFYWCNLLVDLGLS